MEISIEETIRRINREMDENDFDALTIMQLSKAALNLSLAAATFASMDESD